MPPRANLCDLSRAELEALLVEVLGDVSQLKAVVAAQRDEIAAEGFERPAVHQAERDGERDRARARRRAPSNAVAVAR